MEKRKAKPKNKTWGKPSFDFISPYPIDLCVHLLHSQDGEAQHHPLSIKIFPPTGELSIELSPIDEVSCSFRMKWKDKKRPGSLLFSISYATANGYLKSWDSNSTHIAGKIQVSHWYAIWNIIGWLILMGFFVAIGYPFTRAITPDNFVLCLPLIWTAIIAANLFQLIRIRQKLSNILEDILQPIHETTVNSIEQKHD